MATASRQPAIFRDPEESYHADTCDAVRHAVERQRITLHAVTHGAYPGTLLPDDVLPEVCSVGYWDAPAHQDWGLDYHRNEGIELTYLASGHLGFSVDGQEFALRQGHLTITRPWQVHRVGDPHLQASRLHWLILDVHMRRPNQAWAWPGWLVLSGEELAELTTRLSHNEKPVWRADEEIARCFSRLGKLVEQPGASRLRTRLALGINELLLAVVELLRHCDLPLDETLTSSQRTVEMFLSDLPGRIVQEWTVDGMAAQCGLERSRFTYYCRLITNASPIAFLTRCRIEAAKEALVRHPGRSVLDIALECGFGSSQYFATVFRSRTGSSPKEFRALSLA